MSHPDNMSYNPLNNAFGRYVEDAYDAGEFEVPSVTVFGDPRAGNVMVSRKLGDAAVVEIMLAGGLTTDIDNGKAVLRTGNGVHEYWAQTKTGKHAFDFTSDDMVVERRMPNQKNEERVIRDEAAHPVREMIELLEKE